LLEVGFEFFDVRHEHCDLGRGPPLSGPSEQDDGGFPVLPQGEEHAKVGICRNQDAILFCCALEDRDVIMRRHAIISDVSCIMPGFAKTFRQQWR
jgi:hypothetical protein